MMEEIRPCLCGHEAKSASSMKRHRRKCATWASRDAEAVRLERQRETYEKKYGSGIVNAMQASSIRRRHEKTCLKRYGTKSVLSRRSPFYRTAQSGNVRKKAEAIYWKRRATVKTELSRDFQIRDVTVEPGSWSDQVTKFLANNHYAGPGRGPKHIHLAEIGQNLVAVMKWTSPVRKEVATSMGNLPAEVLELDRFCIGPGWNKRNLASFILSKSMMILKRAAPSIRVLVSFADPAQGHGGTIYRAANWTFAGMTRESYIYVNEEGHPMNKKTLYNRARNLGIKEKELQEQMGLFKLRLPPKLKFTFEL